MNLKNLSDESPILKFIEALPDAYVILDSNSTILSVTKAYLDATSVSEDNLLEHSFFEVFSRKSTFYDKGVLEELRSRFEQLVKTGRPFTISMSGSWPSDCERRNGRYHHDWNLSGYPVLNDDGKIVQVIHKIEKRSEISEYSGQLSALRDQVKRLTEDEKQAKRILENQRSTLITLFKQAPVAIAFFKGKDHVVKHVNPTTCQVWGKREEELLEKPISVALPELEEQGFLDLLNGVYETGESFIGKKLPARLEGLDHLAYFNFLYQAVRDDEEQVMGIIMIGTEVTDEVNKIEAIGKSERKFRAMADAVPHIVWSARRDGSLDFVNKRWYSYTGLTEKETMGKGWQKVIHPEDCLLLKEKWEEALQTKEEMVFDYRIRSMHGVYRWHIINAVPVKESESTIKWYGTITDIQDMKETMERLEKISKDLINKNTALTKINNDLDNFVYTASHDLKSPIANLEGLFYNLVKKADGSAQLEQLKKMIDNSFLQFKTTINDLTEIVRADKEEVEDFSVVDIKKMLKEIKIMLHNEISSTGTKISTDFGVQEIRFSIKNFRSILYNLLSNGIKYRHPEKSPIIQISTRQVEDHKVLLTVTDNGLGMDLNKKDKIFGMFKRLHSHVEGSGIGLYIVKRIIENSGGEIAVDSTLNNGSSFKIWFSQ